MVGPKQRLWAACMVCPTEHVLQVNWAMTDKQEFIDVVEVVYRGARKGRGLVVSPKGAVRMASCLHANVDQLLQQQLSCADYSTKYRY